MVAELLFWLGLAVAVGIGFAYFRDLGDIVQTVLKVKRQNMIRFIRKEGQFVMLGLGAAAVAALAHLGFGGGTAWAFWIGAVLVLVFYGWPWVWVHQGLRNQQGTAKYLSVDEALNYVTPPRPWW